MVVLNREEQKVLSESICMLQVISTMGGVDGLLPRLAQEIGVGHPPSACVILGTLAQLEHPQEELVLGVPGCVREFLKDALINVGQLHVELQDSVLEYSKMELEARRERREWLAFECADKLIEPNTLEKLKPIMVKLRGNVQ
jgi:hypothetical protein